MTSSFAVDTKPDLPPKPSELVVARICHDLGNALGVVSNALELATLSGAGSNELDFAGESAGLSVARLKFLRLAFGAAKTEDLPLSAVLSCFHAQDRQAVPDIRLDGDDPFLDGRQARLCALLLMVCRSALPRGGPISVSATGGFGFRASPAQKIPGFDLLESRQSQCDSRDIHFLLAREAAAELGLAISSDFTGDTLSLSC